MANVVIVVDMLKGFHNIGKLANSRVARIIPNIVKLLDKKTKEGWRIIFLRDYHKPNDKEFEIFPPHCIAGTEETELIDELERFSHIGRNTVLNKTRYSGFYRTSLSKILSQEKPDKVIVVGVCTDICVLYTVAELRNRNYEVIVILNCLETFDNPPRHSVKEVSEWIMRHMVDILGVKVHSKLK